MNRQGSSTGAVGLERNFWHPLLAGELRAHSMEAVREITAELNGQIGREISSPSLAGGTSGLAILYTYIDRALPGNGYDDDALRFLNHAVRALETEHLGSSLYGGISGVAWATAHIEGRPSDAAEENSYQAIDDALRAYLKQSPWGGDYDLINGLVGLGVYALERLSHPSAKECLKLVVDRLDEIAERESDSVTWHTSPELLPPHQRAECPDGHHNLGVAHGVPGVIAFLGQVWAAGIERAKVRSLLDGAVRWLMLQKSPAGAAQTFPYWIAPGVEAKISRLAWCYGDLGIANALLVAARCVGEEDWEREALVIARRAAVRPFDESGVVDAGLCHGAAGAGHLFNRMFQATGDAQLGEAARFWFERTLEMRRPGQGIVGFAALRREADGTQHWVDDPGILTGAAGVALALLAAATDIEPEWDRILLVSIPNR